MERDRAARPPGGLADRTAPPARTPTTSRARWSPGTAPAAPAGRWPRWPPSSSPSSWPFRWSVRAGPRTPVPPPGHPDRRLHHADQGSLVRRGRLPRGDAPAAVDDGGRGATCPSRRSTPGASCTRAERGSAVGARGRRADPAAAAARRGCATRADLDELGSVAIAWFTGPCDAARRGDERLRRAPHRRRRRADRRAVADQPYGIRVTTSIVVGAPGDQVELSWFREIAPDGGIFREFEPVETVNGVAALQAGQVDASIDRTLRYRVVRGGTEFLAGRSPAAVPGFVPPRVDLTRLRPALPPARRRRRCTGDRRSHRPLGAWPASPSDGPVGRGSASARRRERPG